MRGWLAPRTLLTCLILLFQFSTSQFIQAQVWSLEDCIHYAWEHNPQIHSGMLKETQQRIEHQGSWAAFLPTLTSGASTDAQSTNPFHWQWEWEIQGNLNLFEGGRRINQFQATKALWHESIAQNEWLRSQLRDRITQQFLQTLLTQELFLLAEQSRSHVVTQRDHTQNLVDAGTLPYASLSELEAQVARVLYQETQAFHQYQQELLLLRQLLNLPPDQPFCLDTNQTSLIPPFEPLNADQLYAQTQQHPQLKVARHQVASTRHHWLAAQGALFPTLFLQAGSNSYLRGEISIRLGLQWTLSNQGHTVRTIRTAELQHKQSQLQLMQVQQDHYKTLQTLIHEATCAYQQFLAATRNHQAQEDAFRHVVNKFNLGLLDGRDYALAHQERIQARCEMLQSQYAYLYQRKILEYYQNTGNGWE